jgi:hypothetical protein
VTRSAWRRAMVAVVAAATTACGTGSHGEALFVGDGETQLCVPTADDPDAGTLFGDGLVRNDSDHLVRIVDVRLLDASHMQLREAYLVPVDPTEGLVGMRHTSNTSPFPPTWEERQVARGTELPPGEMRNLVVEVEAGDEARTASAGPIEIVYENERGGRSQQQQMPTTIYLTRDDCARLTG